MGCVFAPHNVSGAPLTDEVSVRVANASEVHEVSVRVANASEVHEVMRLAVMGAEENSFLPAKTELILNEVWPAVNQDKGICGCIGPAGGQLEAIVILRIGNIYYSEQACVEEKLLFCAPQFRSAKGGRAHKLCEYSKHVADILDLPLLIGVCSSERTRAKVKMYERIFGEPAGAYWLYRTKTGGHTVS
jgi:hypothetical protein